MRVHLPRKRSGSTQDVPGSFGHQGQGCEYDEPWALPVRSLRGACALAGEAQNTVRPTVVRARTDEDEDRVQKVGDRKAGKSSLGPGPTSGYPGTELRHQQVQGMDAASRQSRKSEEKQ